MRAFLGAGGMGEVYAAHDPELDRVVALKILKTADGAATASAIARFQREALAMARLNHPNVVSVFDVGGVGDRVFVAMELIEGPTLRSWLAEANRSWREIVDVFLQAGRGLAAAHAAGIVHRDFKPSNVIVGDRVRVADFGLAKTAAQSDSSPDPAAATTALGVAITGTGAEVGTPAYMAPEQRVGGTVTEHADQYSFCVALREALTGGSAAAPSRARHNARTPRFLEAAVARGLARDPRDRFASMAALLEVLERGQDRARRRAGSSHRTRGLIGVAVLGAVAAAAYGWPSAERAKPPPPLVGALAVLPLDDSSDDATQEYVADGMTEALITELGKIGSLRVIARTSVMKYKGSHAPPSVIARELGVQALVSGSVRRTGDRVRITAHLIDPASGRQTWSEIYERDLRDVLTLQREVTVAIAGEVKARITPPELARLGKQRPVAPAAYEAVLRARYLSVRTTDADSQAVIALLERAVAIDPAYAAAHAALAAAYVTRLTFVTPEPAGELEQKAFAAAEKALMLEPDLPEAYLARGDLLWTPSYHFAHERAAQEFRRAVSLNPSSDQAHARLARVYVHVGLFNDALQHAAIAIAINPSNAQALNTRAEALFWTARDDEALATYASIPAPVLPELVEASTVFALLRLGRRRDASSRLQRAVRAYPADTSGNLAAIGALLVADSDPTRATALIQHVARRKPVNPAHHAAYFVACAYARMRRPAEATEWLREAADSGFPCAACFAHDVHLDPIRQDPSFRALMTELQARSAALRRALFPDRT